MTESVSPDIEEVLRGTYAAFNARDIDAALTALHKDVDWPNMIDGTRAVGHNEIRSYWSRQFDEVDSVHQVIRDKDGSPLDDRMVRHVYTISDDLVIQMDVSPY